MLGSGKITSAPNLLASLINQGEKTRDCPQIPPLHAGSRLGVGESSVPRQLGGQKFEQPAVRFSQALEESPIP